MAEKYGTKPSLAVGHSLGGNAAIRTVDRGLADRSISLNPFVRPSSIGEGQHGGVAPHMRLRPQPRAQYLLPRSPEKPAAPLPPPCPTPLLHRISPSLATSISVGQCGSSWKPSPCGSTSGVPRTGHAVSS